MADNMEVFLEEEEDTQKGKYLTFVIDQESYGIGIELVNEIIGILPITVIPELPVYIRGIINLRGEIIPVMDIRLRFKKKFVEYNERTCIIVISIMDNLVGLIVDSVAEVINIADEDIVPPPSFNERFSNRYIKGIGKVGDAVKLLLECEKLLSKDELEILDNIE